MTLLFIISSYMHVAACGEISTATSTYEWTVNVLAVLLYAKDAQYITRVTSGLIAID